MITDSLRRRKSDGLPNSTLEIIFTDGSSIKETECSWADISEQKRVKYFDGMKSVFVCVFPIEKIIVSYDDMREEILSGGCEMYQAIRSRISGGAPEVLGRCVGRIKNGEVIEEIFLNVVQNEVLGMRK